jgi:hypothetical protein
MYLKNQNYQKVRASLKFQKMGSDLSLVEAQTSPSKRSSHVDPNSRQLNRAEKNISSADRQVKNLYKSMDRYKNIHDLSILQQRISDQV